MFSEPKNEVLDKKILKKIFLYAINTLLISFRTQIISVWRWWEECIPVPTLQTDEKYKPYCTSAAHGSVAHFRKLHCSRLFQVDKYTKFKKEDTLTSVSDVNDPLVKVTIAEKFRMQENNSRINIYKSVRKMKKIAYKKIIRFTTGLSIVSISAQVYKSLN